MLLVNLKRYTKTIIGRVMNTKSKINFVSELKCSKLNKRKMVGKLTNNHFVGFPI